MTYEQGTQHARAMLRSEAYAAVIGACAAVGTGMLILLATLVAVGG